MSRSSRSTRFIGSSKVRSTTKARANSKPPMFEGLENRLLLSTAPTSFQSVGVGGMGSMYSPSISPYNSSEVYLSSDMTDLYHTTNFGSSWNMVSFTQTEVGKQSKVQFTSNANTLYVMTTNGATGFWYASKSTDGGATWNNLPMSDFGGAHPSQIFADPNSTVNIWESVGTSLWFSKQGGTAGSYVNIATTTNPNMYVAGVFTQGTNMYVSTNAGLMVSTNSGTTWSVDTHTGLPATVNGTAVSVYSFAGAYQGGVTRFWALMEPTSLCNPYQVGWDSNYTSFAGIYSIDYATGATWNAQTSALPAGAYPTFISATPTNIATVYAAGGNSTGGPAIWKSTNGGVNWSLSMNVSGNANVQTGPYGSGGDVDWGYVADAFGFAVSPTDPTRAVMTDEGGAFATSDGGATWQCVTVIPADLNPAGQNTPDGKAYHSSLNPTTGYRMTWMSPTSMFADFTDLGGIRSTDGGTTWSFAGGGNTYSSAYDPRTGILYDGQGRYHDLYFNTTWDTANAGGDINYSLDNGATWHLMGRPGSSTDGANGDEVMDIVVDPNVANRLWAIVSTRDNLNGYTVESGIWVANNIDPNNPSSAVWTQMNVPASASGNAGGHPLDLHILNDGTVVVAYSNFSGVSNPAGVFSGMYNSGTNTIAWNADTNNSVMQSSCNDVIIDPQDATQNTWYACAGGYSGGGVFKTTNRGATWSLFWQAPGNTVPDIGNGTWNGAFSAAINAATHEMYISSASQGLWYSNNANSGTPTFSFVSGYDYCAPARVYFDPFNTTQVWVTSFGGGLMEGISNVPTTPPPPTNVIATVVNGGTAIQVNWTLSSGATGYTVERTTGLLNASAAYNWTVLGNLGSSATTYTDSTAVAGQVYYYSVIATDSGGDQDPGNLATGVILPSPTGLTATGAAQGQVNLAWSYAAINNSGFQIQYSTDGVNWTTAATVGQAARLYSVTGLTANTQYTFRIAATNSSSSSAYTTVIGRTFAASGLFAYEGFDYAAGMLNGDNGGSGFSNAWTEGAPGAVQVISTSLTPASPANTLAVDAGSVQASHEWGATRNTTTTFGVNGQVFWASVVLNPNGSGADFNIGSMYIQADPASGNANWAMHTSGDWLSSGTAVATNAVTLAVIRVDCETTGDTFQLWLNPTPGSTAPGSGTAIMNVVLPTGYITSSTQIGIDGTGAYGATPIYDEFRLGANFSDVAPIPVPAAPTGFTATPASSTQINLAWTDNATTETGYHVVRSTDGINWSAQVVLAANTTSYQATGLTPGTLYYFRVSAYDSTGDSVAPQASGTTSTGTVVAPTSLAATVASQTQINLTWTENGTATSYDIYRAPDVSGSPGTFTLDNTSATTSFSDTGLTANTKYWYEVTAVNNGVQSGYSNQVNGTTLANVPTSLAATVASQTQNNLTWSETGTASSYDIFRAPDVSGAPGTFTLDNTSATTSFNDTGLTANTKYWYEVTAVNSAGVQSGHSNQVNATTLANVPTSLTATPASSTQINLGWSEAGTASSYDIFRAPDVSGAPGTFVSDGTSATTSFNDTGLTANTKYWYEVTAVNSAGVQSGHSNQVNATTLASGQVVELTPAPSSTCTVLSYSADSHGTLGTAAVDHNLGTVAYSWDSDNQDQYLVLDLGADYLIDHYRAYFYTANINGYFDISVGDSTVNVAEANDGVVKPRVLGATGAVTDNAYSNAPGGQYDTFTAVNTHVAARYVDIHGIGTAGKTGGIYEFEVWGSAVAAAPAAPSGLSATPVSQTQINLAWTDNSSNETGFKIDRATNSAFTQNLTTNTVGANVTTYSSTGLTALTTYYFRVRATNGSGDSSNSNTALAATLTDLWASDDFNYAAGTLNGDNGGTGFTNAWTASSHSAVNVVSGNMVPSSPANTLAVSGNSVSIIHEQSATRNISTTIGNNGQVYWVSIVLNPGSGSNAGADFHVGNISILADPGSGYANWEMHDSSGDWYGSTTAVALNVATLAVIRIDCETTGDVFQLWVNPTPGSTAPSPASAIMNVTMPTGKVVPGTQIGLDITGQYSATPTYDEFRVGPSFAGVAPVGVTLSNLTVSSSHSASYSAQTLNLNAGISQYGDVTKNFTTIPNKYLGSTWIKTAKADNNVTGVSNFLSFTVNTTATVYVMYDDSITTKPTWLTSQFIDTGDNIVTQQGTFSVFAMNVSAGTVTLGSNLDSGTTTGGMYDVLIVPLV